MASLILKLSCSLDGFIAPATENPGWQAAGGSPDGMQWVLDTVSNASAHLLGTDTYKVLSGFYPTSNIPFAKPMNEIPKVVFSHSLTTAEWGPATIESGDLVEAVTRLKQEQPDGYLLASAGVRFPRALIDAGLIDEYRLVVHPVVLGAGERLFTAPHTLETISTTAFSAGAVAHVFTAQPA